jgi:hypothetical protein
MALRELLERPLAEVGQLGLVGAAADEVERILSQTLAYHGH